MVELSRPLARVLLAARDHLVLSFGLRVWPRWSSSERHLPGGRVASASERIETTVPRLRAVGGCGFGWLRGRSAGGLRLLVGSRVASSCGLAGYEERRFGRGWQSGSGSALDHPGPEIRSKLSPQRVEQVFPLSV